MSARVPLVIAHRGASGERPENTLPAYALAVEQRADMIEIDLHRTRDGAIVIAHDERLPGLPGGREIGECSLAEVRALDAGDGERVPSLDEVLDGFGARIPFNLEIKRGGARRLSRDRGRDARRRWQRAGSVATILFSSFDDGVLAPAARRVAPSARIGVLVSGRESRALARALRRGRRRGGPLLEGTRDAQPAVEAAHRAGLAVYVYTVDDPAEMRTLLDRGCDGLFTNFPARMRELLDRRQIPRGDSAELEPE